MSREYVGGRDWCRDTVVVTLDSANINRGVTLRYPHGSVIPDDYPRGSVVPEGDYFSITDYVEFEAIRAAGSILIYE